MPPSPSVADITLLTLTGRIPIGDVPTLRPALVGWRADGSPAMQVEFAEQNRLQAITVATWLQRQAGLEFSVFSYLGMSGVGEDVWDDPRSRPVLAAYGIDRAGGEAWWVAPVRLDDVGATTIEEAGLLLSPNYPGAPFVLAMRRGLVWPGPGAAAVETWLEEQGHVLVPPAEDS